ncbi:hypothetical protein FOQG_01817 [Fusarium oxysporum f. sp. raphani 54005]|uniref:Uncharacterized protein n=7 Tax=Fusarium oxysporum TaxID=5507 RepID=W9I5H8_FUSOX|nr:hypothetical protein FOYG_09497 [Fusarium oxysporum NRRL 32931]EWZ40312.1 hypothetical protein FOZG_09050 [Fusarium oxysporum Fo47]EWZ87593.1 hypothetical protein FOWG_09407 [Fusarium oxysporum f. sp. lycopersici MN25]EXA41109.1 hypothetical protein FOVG_09664 [Fusarium oxysporum f. sp. pisi HDV247]EXK33990.1 hypothetical protein FOMG_11152 [Fusarium oxysporum f. sp. melonis 26406]EXK99232.1 hypothetical protein FOQG_01817 [Fusarium oxysporum f. sp. raphani 54005]EXL44768.1 hypothetical pr
MKNAQHLVRSLVCQRGGTYHALQVNYCIHVARTLPAHKS